MDKENSAPDDENLTQGKLPEFDVPDFNPRKQITESEIEALDERVKSGEITRQEANKIQAEKILELEDLGGKDQLTGLDNRRSFFDKFNRMVKRASKDPNSEIILIMLDADKFKDINDRLGHPIGDEVLKQLAKALQKSSRPEDITARIGGEEFVYVYRVDKRLLPGQGEFRTLTSALSVANRLRRDITGTIQKANIATLDRDVTVSAGIALLSKQDPETSEQLLKKADVALYKAKESGRNQAVVWTPQLKSKP